VNLLVGKPVIDIVNEKGALNGLTVDKPEHQPELLILGTSAVWLAENYLYDPDRP
jgi:hypothetical protein